MKFLGITFDAVKVMMEIPLDKVKDIMDITKNWLNKKYATRHDMEVIIGKLHFVSKCVRPGRLFVSRMLNQLRGMQKNKYYIITGETRKDVKWWNKFLPQYNGISMLWLQEWNFPDEEIASDACLQATGGCWKN